MERTEILFVEETMPEARSTLQPHSCRVEIDLRPTSVARGCGE